MHGNIQGAQQSYMRENGNQLDQSDDRLDMQLDYTK
jgi:hypothetical protein